MSLLRLRLVGLFKPPEELSALVVMEVSGLRLFMSFTGSVVFCPDFCLCGSDLILLDVFIEPVPLQSIAKLGMTTISSSTIMHLPIKTALMCGG